MAKPILNDHSARFALIGWRAFLCLLVLTKHSRKQPKSAKYRQVSEITMNKVVAFRQVRDGSPNTVNGKIPPIRRRNKDVRSREYLTQAEVDALMVAASRVGRHRHREIAHSS